MNFSNRIVPKNKKTHEHLFAVWMGTEHFLWHRTVCLNERADAHMVGLRNETAQPLLLHVSPLRNRVGRYVEILENWCRYVPSGAVTTVQTLWDSTCQSCTALFFLSQDKRSTLHWGVFREGWMDLSLKNTGTKCCGSLWISLWTHVIICVKSSHIITLSSSEQVAKLHCSQLAHRAAPQAVCQ